MSTWKKIALVNGGSLIGICIALFIASPKTPLWLFAILAGVSLGVLNLIFLRPRRNQSDRSNEGSKVSTVIIIIGILLLLLDLILSRLGILPFRH